MPLIVIAAPENLVGRKILLSAPLNGLSYLTGVGSRRFVVDIKVKLGFNAKRRKVVESNGKFVLKEAMVPYNIHLQSKKGILRPENMYYW